MSRIGQKTIEIPNDLKANLDQNEIKISGPKGELSAPIFEGAEIKISDNGKKLLISWNSLNDNELIFLAFKFFIKFNQALPSLFVSLIWGLKYKCKFLLSKNSSKLFIFLSLNGKKEETKSSLCVGA